MSKQLYLNKDILYEVYFTFSPQISLINWTEQIIEDNILHGFKDVCEFIMAYKNESK